MFKFFFIFLGEYPRVQEALRIILLGTGPYLDVFIEDNMEKNYGHIILAYGIRCGSRKIVICEFNQCRSVSIVGVLLTLGVSAAFCTFWNPSKALIFLLVKCACDYGLTKKDVAVVATMCYLKANGLIGIDNNGRVSLP
jgi:L-lactate permease